MLALLIDEYGLERVRSTLEDVASSAGSGLQGRHRVGARTASRRRAADYVLATEGLDREQRNWLEVLAERFDTREFLPTAGDYKRFMEHNGVRPPAAKNRNDAFRAALRILAKLPAEEIKGLATSSMYSGPVRLDAISDAISERGERSRAGVLRAGSSEKSGPDAGAEQPRLSSKTKRDGQE